MTKKLLTTALLFSIFWGTAQEVSPDELKYRRSSLYTVMIETPGLPYANEIKQYFANSPMPDKFNDHNLGKRVYANGELPNGGGYLSGIQQKTLDDIARDMVAKWFNRSEKGGFNMDLVGERGSYDASAIDIATARASKRGVDMLADAGEELIGKTFVLVNEFKYTDKAEVAQKVNKGLGLLKLAGNFVPGMDNVATAASVAQVGVTVAGKGYIVRTNAHLYQLVWDEATAATFYNEYWADDETITPEKKQAFDQSTIFKLRYIGSDNSWADVQSSIFTNKSEVQLVERATTKAIDEVIVKLQKEHDEFKTKTPLFTGEPITAKIGLKEGLTDKSTFEVIEQRIDENGRTKYVSVGTVRVDKSYPIWDNRYGANEENPNNAYVDRTFFKKVSGGQFYPGLLLVQKGGKGFTSKGKNKNKKQRTNTAALGLVAAAGVTPTGVASYNAGTSNYKAAAQDDDNPNAWFLRAGINSTNYFVNDEGSGLDNRTGIFVDLGYEMRGRSFGFAISAMYSQEGAYDYAGVDYLNLVVLPKFYIADVIFLQAGLEVGFKMNAQDEYVNELISEIDMKIPLGAGIQLGKFFVDFRYRPGILDVNSYLTDSDAILNNNGIQIGAGIKF
ncbi:MAG: hypothetical protein WCY89_04325 [Flavobacteriaceae bacterium]